MKKNSVKGKRITVGTGRMRTIIKLGGEAVEPLRALRIYKDALGNIEVIRSSPQPDAAVEALMGDYTYGNRPLGEVWLSPDDGPYDKPQTEMRVSALALARLGYENVALEGRNPPNPDIFADSRGTGPLAIEVTLNFDQDESQFQRAKDDFLKYLTTTQDGRDFPCHVNLGFKDVPRKREYERVASTVLDQIKANYGNPGAHDFVGEPSQFFSQYIVQPRSDGAIFSGGGVWNDRGHPDVYAATIKVIEQKRDQRKYVAEGRPLWLAVGMSSPALLMPDVMGQLYDTDLNSVTSIVLCLLLGKTWRCLSVGGIERGASERTTLLPKGLQEPTTAVQKRRDHGRLVRRLDGMPKTFQTFSQSRSEQSLPPGIPSIRRNKSATTLSFGQPISAALSVCGSHSPTTRARDVAD